MTTQTQQQQAEKHFPMTDTANESTVMHNRQKWEEAKAYLASRNLSIKPVINVKRVTQ
jgi:hypothetical protein